ncbi:MAG: glycosyltransferase [Nostoc sp.]
MAYISVVIPVYKAEGCLHERYERLKTSFEIISEEFEIILFEDCGGDRSWEIIVELAKKDPRIKGIQFSRNFGQQDGITSGLDYCNIDSYQVRNIAESMAKSSYSHYLMQILDDETHSNLRGCLKSFEKLNVMPIELQS